MSRTILIALLALLVGCETRVYQLRLEPTSAGLRRTLTVWKEKQGDEANLRFEADDLKRLAGLYSEHPSAVEDVRQTFRGTFAERMPADVGGHGTFRTVVTPLGTASWYWERFRGTTDPDGEYYDRRAAVDRLVDLVVGWLDERLQDAPHQAAVHRFLDRDFRQDARNVALYCWLATSDDRPDAVIFDSLPTPHRAPDALLSAGQYLVEHGYLEPSGVGGFDFGGADGSAAALRTVRRLLAVKSGLDARRANALFPFLTDVDEVRASWTEHLKKTPEYARLKKEWKPDPEKPAEADGPAPELVVEDLFAQAVTFELTGNRDELRLTLVVPAAPHETNGEYDAAGGAIAWLRHLHGRRELPTVCYAAWSVPNEKFQRLHFGDVPLAGETLAKFAGYFRQLSEPQRAEVAAHLKTIEPGDALRGRVRDFRFTVTADDEARYVVERMLDLLYESL